MKQRETSHFGLIDWDFKTEDSRSFVHNFCWYPSRFIPIIPCHLIKSLSHPGDLVLDPFCGSGTTILEALKQGRNAIGIDLNPIATFITKVKVNVARKNNISAEIISNFQAEVEHLDAWTDDSNERSLFEVLNDDTIVNFSVSDIPNFEENSTWFHPLTLKMLGYLNKIISKVECIETRELLQLFFISILIPATSHENKKPYTYYADNVKPKEHNFKNALSLFSNKLKAFNIEYHSYINPTCGTAEIYTDDIANVLQHVQQHASVDLVVTSPPYLGVTDYITGYRLVYLWDIVSAAFSDIKKHEIGARWKRKRPTGTDDYLKSLEQFLHDISLLVKRNGYICIILGEAKKHREVVISELLRYAKECLQLDLQDSFCRNVSKNYFLHPKGGVPTEDILIFQRK